MTLLEIINNDLKKALKNKDRFTLGVIRMAKGAIQLETINQKRDLSDLEIIEIISKQIKLRKDSIREFEKADRKDLIDQNIKEIEILNIYMPEQLTEEELEQIIEDVFKKNNPTSLGDLGIIMKEITPMIKGKADIGAVNLMIRTKLTNL